MVEKGYITKEDESELLDMSQEMNCVYVGYHPCDSVSKLFWHTYAKFVARAHVEGEPVVSEYDDANDSKTEIELIYNREHNA